jgi:hypothetical protein
MGKLSLTSKRLMMGGILVALAVVVALVLRETEDPEHPADGKTVSSATGTRIRKPAPSISLPGKQLPNTVESALMDDEVLESIVKKDKKLELFMRYYKAVLPDEQTRDEYRKLLSDPAMMTAMAADLMDPGNGHPHSAEYYRRLMLVDYFEAALTWKGNPQRQKLLELTRDVITKDNFGGDQDSSRRQVLGGSKMELYHLLYAQDAQKAGEMVAQAKGTRMEPLLNWMAEEEVRRGTREQEIMKEADDQVRNN